MELLEAKAKASKMKQIYAELMGDQIRFSCLLRGPEGTGKTTCSCTGRMPIVVESFDPLGTTILHTTPKFKKMQDEGNLIVNAWWGESSEKPWIYKAFDKHWQEICKSGFLNHVGTYVFDGHSGIQRSISNYMRFSRAAYRKNRTDILAQGDYPVIYNVIYDFVNITATHGCDVVYVAHTEMDKDELTGEILAQVHAYKSLKVDLPSMFTEKYTLLKKMSGGKPHHYLLTNDQGRHRASTQLGAHGKFDLEEEPNLKVLLKKAGLSTEDKPPLL